MKHFETKFASTDLKVNFLNLKKIKKIFLEKIRFFKNRFETLICQFLFGSKSAKRDKNSSLSFKKIIYKLNF